MKKIFSFFAALLMAGTMMAQTNLFDASTTTLETWFASGDSWNQETASTGSYDAATGTATITIGEAKWGQWRGQVKFHTTGITLDASKNYEFKCKMVSLNAMNNVTVKVFDDLELSIVSNLALEAGENNYTSNAFSGAQGVGNGVIVFDFGFAAVGDQIVISNIVLQESTAAPVEDPKPTTAPAAPTAEASDVLAVYSEAYPVATAWGYCEGWGQSTALQELDLAGNHVLYYKNFNYLGWGCSATIDASVYNKLHMDIWAAEAGSVNVYPIFGGAGNPTNDRVSKTVTLVAGWNAVDFTLATDFPGLDFSSIFQFKFADGVNLPQFAIDNVYFYEKTGEAVSYTTLAEVYTKANNDTIILKDFDVVYVNGSYCYIKDATASGLIYKANYGLVAGDHVDKGMQAKISIYNNLYELVPITAKADLTVAAGTPAQPAIATTAPTAGDCKYMVYKNVTFLAEALGNSSTADRTIKGIFGNDTITFFNTFKLAAIPFEAGKTYDVTGFNTCYNTQIQVAVAAIEEHVAATDPCAGEHGLYNAATASINSTYLAPNWTPDALSTAEMEAGSIKIHFNGAMNDMWNGQVFVDPGFTFEAGKMYHYEFDVTSTGKVCMTVKVNDSDDNFWLSEAVYDQNIGGGTFHYSTDSVIVNEFLNPAKGPLVFGFGWCDANNDITISCIKITEMGEAPEPVEKHMYIKHPWGTGADADWTWQDMTEFKYHNAFDAWTYTGAWGGVGFNINSVAEDAGAKWFAADAIAFRSAADESVVEAPAVGTENCEFIYIPALEGGAIPCAYVMVPVQTALENTAAEADAVKVIRDGQLIIIRGGVEYNALGQQVR